MLEVKIEGTEASTREDTYESKYKEFMNKPFVKENLNKTFSSKDIEESKDNDFINKMSSLKDTYAFKIRESIMDSFNSKIWRKFAPVLTMIYGDRSREKLDIVDFVDNAIETIYNICNKLGYDIARSTVEIVCSDIMIKYYYEMLKNDIDEGYYFDSYSFRAINDFIESLDADDLDVLKPLANKIRKLAELYYVV